MFFSYIYYNFIMWLRKSNIIPAINTIPSINIIATDIIPNIITLDIINIGFINQDGNQPAKSTWDKMTDPSDKSLNNSPFEVNAFIRQKDQASIWLFEVTEKE